MAISGVNFTIGVDASKGIAGIKNFQGQFNDMSANISGEITKKLKYMFSAVAIEEATRRTAQWAQEIDKSSKALGISAEMMQTLQLLATKTNTPEDAVVGMFENIAKARQEAINGNQDLIQSFQRLGISMEDVMNPKTNAADFASTVINHVPKNLQNATGFERESLQNITGTPPGYLQNLQQGLGGKTLSEVNKSNVEEGSVTKNQEIADISASWAEAMTALKEDFSQLVPVIQLLINLFTMLVQAVGGIITALKGVFQIGVGIATLDWSKIKEGLQNFGGILMNAGLGIVKSLAGLIDWIVKTAVKVMAQQFSHIPLLGKKIKEAADKFVAAQEGGASLEAFIDKQAKQANEVWGTEKTAKQGEALGNVAAIIGTGGEAGIAKATDVVLTKVAVAADKVGMATVSDAALGGALKAGQFGRDVDAGRAGLSSVGVRARQEKEFTKWLEGGKKTPFVKVLDEGYRIEKGAALGMRIAAGIGGISGAYGSQKNAPKGTPGEQFGAIFGTKAQGQFGGINGGETSMLKMGGVFGSGFTDRMIKLNQQMVALLAQIQTNTQATRGEKFTQPTPITGMGGPAGGL